MKRIMFLMMFLPLVVVGQDTKLSKYEALLSNGTEYTMRGYYMEDSYLSVALTPRIDMEIREVEIEGKSTYFFALSIPEISHSLGYTALIEYSELVAINKMLNKMRYVYSKIDLDRVTSLGADVIERGYLTNDDVKIGYHLEAGRIRWYIQLDVHKKSTHALCKEKFIDQFMQAQKDIEELKLRHDIKMRNIE